MIPLSGIVLSGAFGSFGLATNRTRNRVPAKDIKMQINKNI